ncbi:CarboxypepD_reg-like domain-containing protein [Flavobacterium saccharophilum]|uniref:CarboxypepD_reg-like domain-containing protein n=2 Tax=Flavobacterium saccharophilum TaxID=29534 RepID=A0A1M6Z319_9FLAO|nr:CarboxypepD_reg-like domain-containing protein [Flavobacterium saccharophilum]
MVKLYQTDFFILIFAYQKHNVFVFETIILSMKLFCLLTLFFTLTIQAQFQINGIVTDANRRPLPFATITTSDNHNTITDVDGKFDLKINAKTSTFAVSYIGFQTKIIALTANKTFYSISLSEKTDDLKEVVVSNENPALTIIKKVIANKNLNNPQKKLSSFEYKTYNKLIVTANPDSIDGRIDSSAAYKDFNKKTINVDSSDYKFKEIISKQHLFQTEKVSQYQFGNNKLKETILGTKMAGFKQPVYEIIAFNLQSISVYGSKYELFETKHQSPIADNGFADYNYKLLDTVPIKGRDTYMIYFKNKKKRKSNGLEGVLYIDQENFAVAKAVMRIKGVLDISGIHEFEYVPEEKIWFQSKTTFKIVKGKSNDDIKILGGTIQFDGDIEDNFEPRKKTASDFTYLLSESNNFDIHYNTNSPIKDPSLYIEIKDDASKKPEEFWDTYRKDSLDLKSQKTYQLLDSISISKRIEKRLGLGRKIINGYLPIGPIDLDLKKIISYNNYEGFRLGVGGITNDRFSKNFRIEGYTAYGTKDGNFKYSLGSGVLLDKSTNTWLNGSYTDDVREIASTVFAVDKRVFKIYDPRPINISTFYKYISWKANVQTKIIPKTEAVFELARTDVEPKFDYLFNLNGQLYSSYVMTTAMASIVWAPFSDFMQTPTGRNETEKRFPRFTFQYTQSLPNVLENDFTFSKIDFKTEYEKKYLNGQKTSLLLQGGYAMGDVPITHLYNTMPNNLTKETIIQRITFAGRNSFETMFFNEFFSSQYIFFQVKHGFDRIKIMKKVRPSLVLVTRMAWGNMENPEQHVGPAYKTLDKGFFESGIELNRIFKGFGLGGFYRYGPNQLLKFEDNIAVKISYVLDLGL